MDNSYVTSVSNVPSANALQVINKRYSVKSKTGEPTESWKDIVNRVVHHVANAETDPYERAAFFNNAKDLMERRVFLPNTPCLVNAGKPNAQLAGCFVLPVEDSIKGIMRTASDAAIIHQSGGGTGFTFEHLRPAGSLVNTTHGVASGPVSFMEIFDKVTDVVKQGGVRRGANMGIMRCDHPDILRFIHVKNNQDKLTNFNISVSVTDEFMKAVKEGTWIQTMFNGQPWAQPVFDPLFPNRTSEDDERIANGKLLASVVWERIIESAHKWGEPGVVFIDTVNRQERMKSLGPIESCNPCGEEFLHPYNSCNLGSIDVSKFYCPDWNGADSRAGEVTAAGSFHWENFRESVYWAVRFLDNVIDTGDWVLSEIDSMVKRTRPVGLGIMGFADLLLKLKIRYGSQQSLDFLSVLMSNFQLDAWHASLLIGKEKGAFPEYTRNAKTYDEFLWKLGFDDIVLDNVGRFDNDNDFGVRFFPRNYQVTCIAPTGTISLAAETSSGIEPNFAWNYHRADTVGERDYIHPLAAKEWGISEQDPHSATIMSMKKLPEYFVTAHDLSAEEHVRILATAQKYIDNGVSKTCNGHENDTVEDVRKLYELAYSLGVKAVSYYRNGSRENQVLSKPLETKRFCPDCQGVLQVFDGCDTCVNCGFGKCTV